VVTFELLCVLLLLGQHPPQILFQGNSLALLSLLLRDEGDFFLFLNSREGWEEGCREGGGSSLNLTLFSLLLLLSSAMILLTR
jgi:hypothetical protein